MIDGAAHYGQTADLVTDDRAERPAMDGALLGEAMRIEKAENGFQLPTDDMVPSLRDSLQPRGYPEIGLPETLLKMNS